MNFDKELMHVSLAVHSTLMPLLPVHQLMPVRKSLS